MAAFEKVKSGIPAMDKALDFIRLGDNVVFRVSELKEFKYFMEPYVKQAKEDKRNIIYFRFAAHEPLVEDCPEVRRIDVELSHRFETFTVEIHNAIEREGKDAFYVFDCLSELQTAWATDLMMGNFFRVTCPFLFILDTVAFFPIIRGKHSVHSVKKIMDTTQLFLDVYSDSRNIYVRPEKVWERSSDTMFLPHIYRPDTGVFAPIMDGVLSSRFYQTLGRLQRSNEERTTDSWDRFFAEAKLLSKTGADIETHCERMCDVMMTRDPKMREMVKKHFTPEDYFEVRDHMIGTGLIGGKACGMLLARAIIENVSPELAEVLEPHDSFYIGSDVYYTYIVDNDFWDLKIRQRSDDGYFELAGEFADRLMTGSFSNVMEEQFMRIIEYYGQDPYIIRSSSILEDGFGNAFAGKYESVFCANRGTQEARLAEFEAAIKTVYASTMNLSALDYRKRRGLDKRDEQMALLVMRVSGSYYGNYYMPCAAGVGYSYSPYKFLESIDQSAGMLRLVMGLGTSAVDRNDGSYPRLVSLDAPERTVYTNSAQMHKFSQRKGEAVNVGKKSLSTFDLPSIEKHLPDYLKNILLEHDFDAEYRFRERGQNRDIRFISCRGIVKNKELMTDMQRMIKCIEKEYEHPVDTEFSINLSETGEYSVNLLQCRPLQVLKEGMKASVPKDVPEDAILLESFGTSMGLSRSVRLDALVLVDPVGYYHTPYDKKPAVARQISAINERFRGTDKHVVLMVPGRIGTSSPELGVPTSFYDISEFEVICEIEEKSAGYNPELSYGSHIFQDLVEADILYSAVFDNEKKVKYHPGRLERFDQNTDGVVTVYDLSGAEVMLYYSLEEEHLLVACQEPGEPMSN